MSSFKNTLKKIITEKEQNTPQLRQNIYNQARKNLLAILEKQKHPEEIKQQKIKNLEHDILSLENEYVTQQKASILQLNNIIAKQNLKAQFTQPDISIDKQNTDDKPKQNNKQITNIFSQIKSKELRNKTKKNVISLLLGSAFAIIFIFSCIGIAWQFFASRNRDIFTHEIINTKLDTGVSTEKFDGRLINENKNKHNTPTMVETTQTEISSPSNSFDSASYMQPDQTIKPANVSWTAIANRQNKTDIVSAKVNVIDSNTQITFSLQHNFNKAFKGEYAISIIYNDEKYNIRDIINEKTDINLIIKGLPNKLAEVCQYNPTPHNFVFSFNDTKNNLENIKKAESVEIKFLYKNQKTVIIKFSKNKNGKIFFDNFN